MKKGEKLSDEQKAKMKAGREKNKEQKSSKNEKIKKEHKESSGEDTMSVDRKLDILIGAVGKLVELQTNAVEASSATYTGAAVPTPVVEFQPQIQDETYPKSYLPPAYRKIVDGVLSKDFGAEVTDFEDRTDFMFTIVVPDKYSSVSKEDRDRGVQDRRSRMISRALGENGIKEWCQLVRKNLSKYYATEGKASPFESAASQS